MKSYISRSIKFLKSVANEGRDISYPDQKSVVTLIAVVSFAAAISSVFFVLADFVSAKTILFLMKL